MVVVRAAWILILLYFVVLAVVLLNVPIGHAQPPPAELNQLVKTQFGPCFEIPAERATMKYLNPKAGPSWVTFLTGDLNGDGIEDAAIVARCKTPLAGEVDFNYRVIDPYYTYYGFSNAQMTLQFMNDPDRQNLVLVLHGAGRDGWRAAAPKAKFVMLNLPFETIALTKFRQKKRAVTAVNLIEAETLSSVVFWDGKKYKWAENGR